MNTALSAAIDAELDAFYQEYPECFHPFLMKEREDLFANRADPEQIANNTLSVITDLLSPHMGFDRSDGSQKKIFAYICDQIYLFFRKNGYEEEHYTALALKEMLITSIAVQIIQETNWNAAIVTAAVTLVLSSVLKIGIRAWCQFYEEKHPDVKI